MNRKYFSLGLVLYLAEIDSQCLCNSFPFLVSGTLTFFSMANLLIQISV